jgi:prepilin-type N-terminal cleavage/methylation domain-containing protein
MPSWCATSASNRRPERGFTLIELLVVIVVGALLLAGFTTFYLSQQRNYRHHQVEIQLAHGLRSGLEQMVRDIRSARRDMIHFPNNVPTILQATATTIEFELDAAGTDSDSDDGAVTAANPKEHKGFRLTGTTLERYDASTATWTSFANNITALTFAYLDCNGNSLATPLSSSDRAAAAVVDVSITASTAGALVGGIASSLTENERVRLRNKQCP